jgi:hypothetical protein
MDGLKSKYYKNYKNKSGIDAYRLDIWKTKYEIIKEHNKKFEKVMKLIPLEIIILWIM